MYKTFLFFLFFSFIFSKSPYQIENDVLDLNERTFSIAIREFKNLVILFYDPECPHCEKIMPEYEKAAADLTKENFVLSKLDSIKAKKIADRYEIEKLPTIKIVQSSEVLKMYDGNGKADDIEKWVKDTTKPEFKTIKTKDELESLKKFHKVLLVLFGKSEKTMKELILAERIIDDVPFVIADSDELIQEYKQKNRTEFIYIFKQFDDNKVFMKEKITSKNIIKFCHLFSQPKVIEFSKDNSNLIFIKRNPALVIFSIKSERHYEDSVNLFNYMWKNTKDKIRLVVVDIKDPDGAKLAEFCGVKPKDIPKVYIIHSTGEVPYKYEMTGGINEENMGIFMNKFFKGKLEPYIRSEPIPKNNDDDIFVLVGKTFKKEVLQNDKDVLVYIVSPWCKVCKEMEPKLAELYKKLKKNNPKLLFTKINGYENDIEDYQIHSFPTTKFYPGNAKDKEPLNFMGRKNIDGLIKFIKKNAYHKIIDEDDLKKNSDL